MSKRNHDYRKIWINAYGKPPKDEDGISYEIHHIDGDHTNDVLENLTCIPIAEHFKIHLEQGDIYSASCIARRMNLTQDERKHISKLVGEANKRRPNPMGSSISREKVSIALKGKYVGEKHWAHGTKRPEHSEIMKQKGFGKNKTEEHIKKAQETWIINTKDNPIRALTWLLEIDGKQIQVKNLKKYCRDNNLTYSTVRDYKYSDNIKLLGKC